MGQDLLSSGISKNGRKIWKWECGSTQWKVKYMVYERNMKITIWACWFQNKMIALYSSLFIRSCAFKIWYCRKQDMYCFFPFGLINVIISAFNPCDPYSRFVGAESCIKVCFRSFGSIHTNLWSSTYLARRSCCHYFFCLAVCCLHFFYKNDIVSF